MYDFSQYITKDEENLNEYCNMIFKKDGEKQTNTCLLFFTDLAAVKEKKGDFTSCRASILKPLLDNNNNNQKMKQIELGKKQLLFSTEVQASMVEQWKVRIKSLLQVKRKKGEDQDLPIW